MRRIDTTLALHRLLFSVLLVAALSPAVQAQTKPEAVGFSSERLQRVDAAMQRLVDEKKVAGIVTVATRHGKVFQSGVYGLRDIESKTPITRDTIFRLHSMTKPVTGVAMMILYEEGKWSPNDPISKHIPEFANLKVFKSVDALGKMEVEDPVHAPTMRELMTHTAGFSYGAGKEPVAKLYKDDKGNNMIFGAPTSQEMMGRLAKIPLAYQPGTRWVYSVSVDIQGYIVEKLSGQTLPEFMRERIFKPLGMKDTGFYVPPQKRDRFATLYKDVDGKIANAADSIYMTYEREPTVPFGGAGLVSTAGDYLRFAQMLANGGEFEGVRILGPETVKMMSANHLPQSLMPAENIGAGPGPLAMRPGHGFGYDFAVYTEPALADSVVGKGSYYWGGGGGTWFWIDPEHDIVFVGMVQSHLIQTWDLQDLTQQTLYQALIDPKK